MHAIAIAACAVPGSGAITAIILAIRCYLRAEPEFPPPGAGQ